MKGNHMFIKTAAIICMISLTGCGSWEPEVQQIPEDVPVSDSETEEQDIASADAPSDSLAEREPSGNMVQEED